MQQRTKYGQAPVDLGKTSLKCNEMMLYQYLPVKMAGQLLTPNLLRKQLPTNLNWLEALIWKVSYNMSCQGVDLVDHYLYVTAKNLWASADNKGNRHGWHSDGFGGDDLSYIWYDCLPTEFAVQNFYHIDEGCNASLKQFEEQVDIRCIRTYPNQNLLRLDETVIHRVSESKQEGFRTFVKINVSKDKYDLQGNSHNYLIDYDWDMKKRWVDRNHPHSENN